MRKIRLPEEEAKSQKAEFAKSIPLKSIADPEEMAGAIIYLASNASRFTTGATIILDGGMLISSPPMARD